MTIIMLLIPDVVIWKWFILAEENVSVSVVLSSRGQDRYQNDEEHA